MKFLYTLKGKKPALAEDMYTWAKWFETADRRVAKTQVTEEVEVSTVFLAVDHNHGLKGPPILFETMIFGGKLDGECNRYTTWEKAMEGHREMVKMAEEGNP